MLVSLCSIVLCWLLNYTYVTDPETTSIDIQSDILDAMQGYSNDQNIQIVALETLVMLIYQGT